MKAIWAMALVAGALVGCGGNGQSPECKRYVDCVAKLAGSSASVESTYGADGSCWSDQAAADACTKKCKTALAAFPAGSGC